MTGTVLRVYPVQQKVLVEGANRVTKHTKVGQTQRGEDRRHRPPGSADPHQQRDARGSESKKRTRVGSRFDDDGNKIRVAKRSSKDVS